MLLYVTNVYPRNHLILRAREKNIPYKELSPWVPSERVRKLSEKLWPSLNQIFNSRQFVSVEDKIHHLNLSFLSNYSPFCRHILRRQPNVLFAAWIREFETHRINKFIAKSKVSVVTSDFINPRLRLTSELNLIEFRWHHTHLNSIRIPGQLSFPAFFDSLEFNDEKFNRVLSSIDKNVDFYIFYSHLSAKSFVDHAGLSASKILVTPLVESFEYVQHGDFTEERAKDLLYVGRGEYDKGVDLAIAMAKQLNCRLTIIGNFSSQIRDWIESFDFVDFLGVLPRPDVYRNMREHKILLATGIESFGFAVLEAISNGMFIVGTEFCGSLNYSKGCARVFVSDSNSIDSLIKSLTSALNTYHNRLNLKCNHLTNENDWNAILNLIKNYC